MNSKISPDLILHNGRITTLDPNHPEATSLAIKADRIAGVDETQSQRGPNTVVIDLNGRRVVPGLESQKPKISDVGASLAKGSAFASSLSCKMASCAS